MWSPRRLLLVLVGLVLFGTAYAAYSLLLGGVNGLPALPPALAQAIDPSTTPDWEYLKPSEKPVEARIRLAFGPDPEEMRCRVKLYSEKDGILLAAGDSIFRPDGDGRVELTPCSIAFFGKSRGPDGPPEISTIYGDHAWLRFEKPVYKPTELDVGQLVSIEFVSDPELKSHDPRRGQIVVMNNRKSAAQDDDLEMITSGSLLYAAHPSNDAAGRPLPHISTASKVTVYDHQNVPPSARSANKPMAQGDGMQVFMSAPPPTADPKAPAKSSGAVERIRLLSNVEFNRYSSSGTGFAAGFGPPTGPAQKPDPDKPPSLMHVRSPGGFDYDLPEELAKFFKADRAGGKPDMVEVTQYSSAKGRDIKDWLSAEYLDLRFVRPVAKSLAAAGGGPAYAMFKPQATPGGGPMPSDSDRQVESMHAWGDVFLSSEGEKLNAWGSDLVFNKKQGTGTLVGSPMFAEKDGTLMSGKSLVMTNLNDKARSMAVCEGPGSVGMGGRPDPVTRHYPREALFSKSMTYAKVEEQGKPLELIVFEGDARFTDTPALQALKGDRIRLWLLPRGDGPSEPSAGDPAANAKPHHLEVVGHVEATSSDVDRSSRRSARRLVPRRHAGRPAGPGSRRVGEAGHAGASWSPLRNTTGRASHRSISPARGRGSRVGRAKEERPRRSRSRRSGSSSGRRPSASGRKPNGSAAMVMWSSRKRRPRTRRTAFASSATASRWKSSSTAACSTSRATGSSRPRCISTS